MNNTARYAPEVINSALSLYRESARRTPSSAEEKIMMGLSDAYVYGQQGNVPPWLDPFIPQAKAMLDPEWAKYQELKKKFAGF